MTPLNQPLNHNHTLVDVHNSCYEAHLFWDVAADVCFEVNGPPSHSSARHVEDLVHHLVGVEGLRMLGDFTWRGKNDRNSGLTVKHNNG